MDDWLQRVLHNNKDEEAWQNLFLEYKAFISIVLNKFIFDTADHPDVEQEIWLKVFRNIGRYDCSQSFKAWLFILSKRVCFDWIKKKNGYVRSSNEAGKGKSCNESRVVRMILYEDAFQENAVEDGFDFTEQLALRQLIDHALSQLGDSEQVTAFKLQYFEGLSLNQIAKILGKPASTIHNWPNRVKEKIKPILMKSLEKNRFHIQYQ